MSKRKIKNPSDASDHAGNGNGNGKPAGAEKSAKRPKKTRAGAVSKTPTETAAATSAETPPASSSGKRAKRDKMSALDAAAKVLEEAGQPMNCQEMIDAMAKKGYWSSPGGRTPAATLYSAILRELKVKGAKSRFRKTERGRFART